MELDGSKLPSDGLAPLGLGALQRKELRRMDSYEEERAGTRTGVGHVPVERRRQVIGVTRAASQDRVEADNVALKRAHSESIREHIRDLRAKRELEQKQSAEASAGAPSAEAASSAPATAEGPPPPASAEAAASAPDANGGSRKRPRQGQLRSPTA